jgi:hypothetical protein
MPLIRPDLTSPEVRASPRWSRRSSQLAENDPAKRFVNQKAQFYQTLAEAFERDQIDGLIDDVTIGQLANILHEIDSHGRTKIEPKEKARARGIASPDRAEALMLALGKPIEPILPLWILRDRVIQRHREGLTEEAIAEKLEVTIDEVRSWLQEEASQRNKPAPSPFRKLCALCGIYIEDNVLYTKLISSRFCHVKCARNEMFGSGV